MSLRNQTFGFSFLWATILRNGATLGLLCDNRLRCFGKRSPDGTLLEAAYNREIAQLTLAKLQAKGHKAQLLVSETEDIPLKERVPASTPTAPPSAEPTLSSSASTSTPPATDHNG